ncbi:MAG: GspE/PulE family protein [Planctomycetota bacterium]
MGKFDLDDILGDLDPEGGPKEPGTEDAAPADSTPDVSAGGDTTEPLFVRNDPAETPRPPDPSGQGLGGELGVLVTNDADPARVRPEDALTQIYKPTEIARIESNSLADALVHAGVINNEHVSSLQRVRKQTPGKDVSEILIEMGIEETAIQTVRAAQSRLTFERIDPDDPNAFDMKIVQKLSPEFCRDNLVLPLRREGSRLVVGTTNPDDLFLLDDIKRRVNVASIKHVLVAGADIRAALEHLQEEEAEEYNVDEILADVDEDDVEVVKDELDEAGEEDAESSPVVRYVNHIIQTAVKEGASDIHIEPEEKTLKVRFRIDGVLFEMMNPPKKMHASLTSRIKIMSNLDIAERRLPQDGRIRATVLGRKLDLRVSTLPTPKGEKTVMRILDNRSIQVGLDDLGFAEDTLTIWKKQIAQPHGIILVTGPTGSGKTTTLYSSLRQMDLRKLNISTVEDPVEYNLASVTQVQTHEKIGMTFGASLRALMRQDPDVIMVGEIRDMETATIAIQAALTGHLVLSTLHTNDAPSSITRLINIGIEPFLIGGAVNAVLAQRLTRRVCENCKQEVAVSEDMKEFLLMHGLNRDVAYEGTGCNKCRETGYSGRVGLYEMLLLDDHIRDAVARNPNVTEFRRVCTERGMRTLREDGFQKVAKGFTTVPEVLRVTDATI